MTREITAHIRKEYILICYEWSNYKHISSNLVKTLILGVHTLCYHYHYHYAMLSMGNFCVAIEVSFKAVGCLDNRLSVL